LKNILLFNYHIMGKQHGTLAKAGKVRKQTPKVAKTPKKAPPRGRAYKRMLYNKRFGSIVANVGGKKRGPNYGAGRPADQLNKK
jgi:small subunit ribosomal protein S30e